MANHVRRLHLALYSGSIFQGDPMTRPLTSTASRLPTQLLVALVAAPLAFACSDSPDTETPDATVTPDTPTATVAVTPTPAIDTPTPTAGLTATPTATATAEATPTPTAAGPTPTPTAAPTPVVSTPAVGDVIFTEFQYAPRQVSDDAGEWVEIHNTTDDKTFAIDTWGFSVATGDGGPNDIELASTGAVLLGPGAYAVFGNNANASENGNVTVDLFAEFFLSSGGFTLTVSDADGNAIDQVTYDPETYLSLDGHSVSLGAGNETAEDNDDAANWCASFDQIATSTDYGTPGAANGECGADEDADGYYGENDCDDTQATVNTGAPDIGENSTDDDCDGEIDEAPAVAPGSLIITEFIFNPGGDESNKEWVELLNDTDAAIDLQGFTFADNSAGHVILDSVVVEAGAYVVIGSTTNTELNGEAPVAYAIPDLALNNSGDSIIISYDNWVIDELTYSGPDGWENLDGFSISLDPRNLDFETNDTPANWCLGQDVFRTIGEDECTDSVDNDLDFDVDGEDDDCADDGPDEGGDYGSPGEANPECAIDNDGDGFRPPEDCDDTDANIFPGQTEVADNSKDDNCDGDVDEVIPVSNSVIITEILYDSALGSDADGEYIELYNTTDAPIDLLGWGIADLSLINKLEDPDNTAPTQHTIDSSVVIAAGGYVVLAKVGESEDNGGITPDYVYGNGGSANPAPSLNNGGDSLALYDGTAGVSDRVDYDDGGEWPTKVGGYSIQLSTSALNSSLNDLGIYWCTSSEAFGPVEPAQYGTPGTANDDCRPFVPQ